MGDGRTWAGEVTDTGRTPGVPVTLDIHGAGRGNGEGLRVRQKNGPWETPGNGPLDDSRKFWTQDGWRNKGVVETCGDRRVDNIIRP